MREFWMVWKDGGGAPTAQHWDAESARREAERLALTHGGKFHVLKAIATCSKPTVMWEEPHEGRCDCLQCIPF